MRHIVAGTSLVLKTPRLWKFIIQPFLVGVAAFIAVTVGSYFLIVPRLSAAIESRLHANEQVGQFVAWLTSGLYVALIILTSGMLYLAIVSFFSSMLWEKLSLEIELMQTGQRMETKMPVSKIISDSLIRGGVAIGVALLSLCCGWVFFGIPAVLMAGWMGLYDYTSSSYMRRGIVFVDQPSFVRRLPGRGGFLIGAGLITLLPLVNVLMLPCLVAGGTLMVIEGEGRKD